jgi:chromosomal replication initiation ATPase DnaA
VNPLERSQFALEWPVTPRFGHTDFLISDSNRAAFDLIKRWPDWGARALVLYGPPGSGKTHLAHLWCQQSGAKLIAGAAVAQSELAELPVAVAIDDAEHADERPLLHLYNLVLERGGSLLLTMSAPPAAQLIGLADLASRLRALPTVGIASPDDALLAGVLVKHLVDRQILRVAPEVIAYLVPRIERSFAAVGALAARLDQLSLETGRPITIALARTVLSETG